MGQEEIERVRDIHSHIIFGVDDGAKSLNESIAMVAAAERAGITQIVATPHVRGSHFNHKKIVENFEALKPYLRDMQLQLGYEVHYDNLIQMGTDKAHKFVTHGTNEFLLELPMKRFPIELERTIFELQAKGLRVIIAHPERYEPIQADISRAVELVEMGCELQISTDCVSNGFLDKRKRCAKKLLKNELVSYLASDAHFVEHYQDFALARQKVSARNT